MSGVFPASPAPARVSIGSVQPARVSLGHSLKRNSRTLNAQRFSLKLIFAPMTQSQFAPIWAHCIAQRGQYDTFTYALPSRVWPLRGAGGGSPAVNNQAGSPEELQTASRNVASSGWGNGVTVLKAGDLVTFGGHSKVYLIRSDVTSNGSGLATLPIEPALITGPAHGAAITISPVTFTCALEGDVQEFEAAPRAGNLAKYRYEVDLVEAY